jgi:hypothetical protein
MRTPKWAVGMRVLAPGIYADADGGWHIDERAICAKFGVPYTKENCEQILMGTQDAFAALGIHVPIRDAEDD